MSAKSIIKETRPYFFFVYGISDKGECNEEFIYEAVLFVCSTWTPIHIYTWNKRTTLSHVCLKYIQSLLSSTHVCNLITLCSSGLLCDERAGVNATCLCSVLQKCFGFSFDFHNRVFVRLETIRLPLTIQTHFTIGDLNIFFFEVENWS